MNPLSLFSGPYAILARIALVGIILGASFLSGWVKGNQHGTQKLTDYKAAQSLETIKVIQGRENVVTKIETIYKDKIKQIYIQGETITKEIPVYVTKIDDAGCVIPIGFVREYNASWTGETAGPPAESDRRSSGLSLSYVAEIDSGNATSCRVYKEQRDGLIKFYQDLQKIY